MSDEYKQLRKPCVVRRKSLLYPDAGLRRRADGSWMYVYGFMRIVFNGTPILPYVTNIDSLIGEDSNDA